MAQQPPGTVVIDKLAPFLRDLGCSGEGCGVVDTLEDLAGVSKVEQGGS